MESIKTIPKILGVQASYDYQITETITSGRLWNALIEFSLYGFHWIQRIQQVMTMSKNGLIAKGSTHLATNTLPVAVILRAFPLLPLVWCLLPLSTLNRYQTRDINGNFFFTTAWRNISVVRYGLSLVIVLLLDLVKIHWIQWIQQKPFREKVKPAFTYT